MTSGDLTSGYSDFDNTLESYDFFGIGKGAPGDLDSDGVQDLIIGAPGDDDGGSRAGAIYVLLMKTNGRIKASQVARVRA